MDGFGRAVVGVWRAHTVLDESDGAESSPEVPDHFRKMCSSSSLGSLRMSLRKRLPLRSIQANSLPETSTSEIQREQPKPNTARKLSRSARNSISEMCQRFQRTREFSRECLVATPGRDTEIAGASSCTPRRTPHRAATQRTPRSILPNPAATPGSRERKTLKHLYVGVKTGRGRRQLFRMAALRSPFSSPNTEKPDDCELQKFDKDLESVSSGIRRLKHLSKAFDDIIRREEKPGSSSCPGGALMRKLDPSGKLSRSNLTRRASNLSNTLGGCGPTQL
ncbi:LOW QUALITY PROTEIN: protein PIMREG [Anableps anableps]